MNILLMVTVFMVLLIIGFPVLLSLLLPVFLYVLINNGQWSTITYNYIHVLNNYSLIAIPLFILVGNLTNKLGATEKIFNFARVLFKNVKGYSLRVNVLMSLIFAGISGSMLADITGLGQVEIESARSEGYPKSFGGGLTIATATVGPMFPPSIPLIIYAMSAQVSSVRALMAGVFPALVITGAIYIYVICISKKRCILPANENYKQASNERLLPIFLNVLPILLLVPLIMFSMLFGIFSPTEAGAGAVALVILIGAYYKNLSLKKIFEAVFETLKMATVILSVVGAGSIFSNILVQEGLAEIAANVILGISENKLVILFLINLLVLILGMFLEGITILLLVTPILIPIALKVGIDPIHLGILMNLSMNFGLITPPFGMGLFAVSEVAKVPIGDIVKDSIPLMGMLILVIIILTLFPQISVWLPNLVL